MEELLVVSALAGFVALFVTGLIFKGRPLRGEALDRFEGAARTIKGTIDPGTWFRRPRLTFDASGCPAEITWTRARGAEDGSNLWLLVTVSGIPGGDLKIWRKSRPWIFRIGGSWSCPQTVIGDPEIDGEFVIQSQPPALAERLFAPERRALSASLVKSLVGDDAMFFRGGIFRTSFPVNTISPSGISELASSLRKMTALLQELSR